MISFIYRLANWTAIVGGIVLVAMTLMVVASVAGRAMIGLGLGPVPGDFELVEVGVGIAIFYFLPWCYLRGGHATVDLLYMHMPAWFKKGVDLFSAEIVDQGIGGLLAGTRAPRAAGTLDGGDGRQQNPGLTKGGDNTGRYRHPLVGRPCRFRGRFDHERNIGTRRPSQSQARG